MAKLPSTAKKLEENAPLLPGQLQVVIQMQSMLHQAATFLKWYEEKKVLDDERSGSLRKFNKRLRAVINSGLALRNGALNDIIVSNKKNM